MTTNKIELDVIKNTKAQAVVNVDSAQGWVTIKDINDSENSVFLQGDEGYQFIDNAKAMYEKNGDISLDDAYYFLAHDYLDLLAE